MVDLNKDARLVSGGNVVSPVVAQSVAQPGGSREVLYDVLHRVLSILPGALLLGMGVMMFVVGPQVLGSLALTMSNIDGTEVSANSAVTTSLLKMIGPLAGIAMTLVGIQQLIRGLYR